MEFFIYNKYKKPLDQFPGRVITAELPKLPRPEIGKILPNQVFRKQIVFHPIMESGKEVLILREIIQRVQRHILERRIRIHEFFKVVQSINIFVLKKIHTNEINRPRISMF